MLGHFTIAVGDARIARYRALNCFAVADGATIPLTAKLPGCWRKHCSGADVPSLLVIVVK